MQRPFCSLQKRLHLCRNQDAPLLSYSNFQQWSLATLSKIIQADRPPLWSGPVGQHQVEWSFQNANGCGQDEWVGELKKEKKNKTFFDYCVLFFGEIQLLRPQVARLVGWKPLICPFRLLVQKSQSNLTAFVLINMCTRQPASQRASLDILIRNLIISPDAAEWPFLSSGRRFDSLFGLSNYQVPPI